MADRLVSADRRGVVVNNAARTLAKAMLAMVPKQEAPELSVERDAYLLAQANKHKPWARRYLRQRGRLR